MNENGEGKPVHTFRFLGVAEFLVMSNSNNVSDYLALFLSMISNGNLDGMVNSRFTIAVGAVDPEGKLTQYTTPGAPVFITAPAGDDECMFCRIFFQLMGHCQSAFFLCYDCTH